MTVRQKKSALVWLRQALLFYVLIAVALGAYLNRVRSTDWDSALTVAVYPVNQDDSQVAEKYIDQLTPDTFASVVKFLEREARRYDVDVDPPLRFAIGKIQDKSPPTPPASGGAPAVIWWSLKLRYHAWRAASKGGVRFPDIRLFVLYHDPENNPRLAHSLGIEQGLIGVVNAYASRHETSRNAVVVAHEILHTLGASDKYDPATTLPIYPDGYAQPDREPLFPQLRAEIMGGRTALSESQAIMPESLRSVVVGPLTAAQINWVREP